MNAFQKLFILFATALLTANGQNEIYQQNIGIPDSFSNDLGSGNAQSTGFVPQQNIGVPENLDELPNADSAQQQAPQHSGQSGNLGQSPGPRGRPGSMQNRQKPANFEPQQNIGVPENLDELPNADSGQQQAPQHSGQSNSLGQSRSKPTPMAFKQGPSNFEPQQNIGVPDNLNESPNANAAPMTSQPAQQVSPNSEMSDSLGQSAARTMPSSESSPQQNNQLPEESNTGISPRAMPTKQKPSNFDQQQNIGVPENLDELPNADSAQQQAPQHSGQSRNLGQSPGPRGRPGSMQNRQKPANFEPQQNIGVPENLDELPNAGLTQKQTPQHSGQSGNLGQSPGSRGRAGSMQNRQKPSNFEPQQNIGVPENLDELPNADSGQQQAPQHSGQSNSLGQSRSKPTPMAFKQGPSNFEPQQNIGVPDNLNESPNANAAPMTSQPAQVLPNSEMSDSLGQSATRPMPSSQSQKTPQQNMQLPKESSTAMSPRAMPQSMNAPGNLAQSPDARMGPMSMSANQRPSSFFPQQNIGIPDNFEETPDTGSGMGLSGFVPQRKISPGSFGPSNFVPQKRIGTPDSFNEFPVSDGEVAARVGNGPMVPLAVNTKHMVQYVDTPSTYSMMDSSSGSSLGGSRSRGGSYPSQQPISQQKIGIPSGGGNQFNSGARGGGRKFFGNGNRFGNGAAAGGGRNGFGGGGGQVIQLPVISRHSIQYVDVPSSGQTQPITVQIPATRMGVNFNFKTGSSNLRVSQSHEGSPGSYQETSSVDEPIRMSHTVRRPIYQETRQNIQPYRMVTQSIQPVQENIHTIVAVDGNRMRGGYSNNGQGSSLGGGYSRGPSNFGRAAKNRPGYNSNQLGSGYRQGGGNRRFYDGSYGKGQQKLGNW